MWLSRYNRVQTSPGEQEKGTVLETAAEDNELDFKTYVLVFKY